MNKTAYRVLIAFTVVLTALGVSGQAALGIAAQPAIELPVQGGPHGVQVTNMDLTVSPGDDFYQFANGGWLADNELLPNEPSFGSMDEASAEVAAQLYATIQDLDADDSTPGGKVRTIFDQAMDVRARNRDGIDPVMPILDSILDISSIEDGLAYQQRSFRDNLNGLFIPYADSDPGDATMNVAWLAGPFLSLPSEDYYLGDDEKAAGIRDAWVDATAQLLVELGYDNDEAQDAAEAVLAFETEIARAKTPIEEQQANPDLFNNPRTVEELQEILPGFDWTAFLDEYGIGDQELFYVDDIAYLESLDGILADADPNILQYLFATQLAWQASSYLTEDMEEIAFEFQGGALLGIDEIWPIEGRALSIAATYFPDALSEAYVAEEFPPEAKEQIEDLVDNLIAAFRIRIEQADWMSDETKAQAIAKLEQISVKVGYPDEWNDYEDVAIGDSLWESALNASRVLNEQDLANIGEPVDRDAWQMAAFEVNAYYSPTRNEIVFPAGILQPPFFDPEADLASNYGGIGAVIGHEITHGFDLSGSQFDGQGNLADWWTEDDIIAFEDLNDRVAEHYSSIEAIPGVFVDGDHTVTENVADMGGVQVAYDALMIALDEEGNDDRFWMFDQEQRFFIAFSSNWRELARDEFVELLIASDEHAPAPVRSVEPIRMMDEFYEAFDIGPGDPMYLPPEDRIVIW